MANGSDSPAPPMSESLGMPQPPVGGAGLAASQAATQVASQDQTAQPPQSVQPPEPPQHHNALAGVLAAIAGPDITHKVDPTTGQMTTVATPLTPGNAFRKILAGALTGMGAGAAAASTGHPGAGILGGIGAGGTAVMNRQQALNQQDIQNQREQFKQQQEADRLKQEATLNQAHTALLAQQTTESLMRMTEAETKIDDDHAKALAEQEKLVTTTPGAKKLGGFSSWQEFYQHEPELLKEIAGNQGKGQMTPVAITSGGKVIRVDAFYIPQAWKDQLTTKEIKYPILQPRADGKPGTELAWITEPAGSRTQGEANNLLLAQNDKLANVAINQEKADTQIQATEARMAALDARLSAQQTRTEAQEFKQGMKWASWTDPATGRQVAGPVSQGKAAGATDMVEVGGTEVKDIRNARQVYNIITKRGDPSKPETQGVLQLIDSLDKSGKLGLLASRWNRFMSQGVGADPGDDPRIITLIDKNMLSDTGTMLSHFGASGGRSPQMLQHFLDLANASKMDGPTLKAGTLAMADYMRDRGMMPGGQTQAGPGGGAPPPTAGMILARDPSGQLHQAKPGTPLPQGWKLEEAH